MKLFASLLLSSSIGLLALVTRADSVPPADAPSSSDLAAMERTFGLGLAGLLTGALNSGSSGSGSGSSGPLNFGAGSTYTPPRPFPGIVGPSSFTNPIGGPSITFNGPAGCGSGLPPSVTGLQANPGDGRVTLTWSPPASGGCVSSYEVAAFPLSDTRSFTAPLSLRTTTYSLTVSNLINGVRYRFQVTAISDTGRSSSASIEATPYDIEQGTQGSPLGLCLPLPAQAPRNIRYEVRDSAIYLCWDGPAQCVTDYSVSATPVSQNFRSLALNNIFRSPGGCLNVQNLMNGVQYEFVVTPNSPYYGPGTPASIRATPQRSGV